MFVKISFLLLVAFCCVASVLCQDLLSDTALLSLAQAHPERAFKIWLTANKKSYDSNSDYAERQDIFTTNTLKVEKLANENPEAKFALNEFADLTWEEFSATRLGLNVNPEYLAEREARNARLLKSWRYANVTVPAAIDWRDKNAVAEVKNQGQCGSCWAFSTTGAIEGINALVTGKLVSLSEQQLVDCDTQVNQGCSGGLMDEAYKYILDNKGVDTEGDYGYYSSFGFGTWCNRRKEHDRTVVNIQGFEDVPQDEASLQRAVAKQPVSVGICAGAALQFYSRGVLSSCCQDINHAVLAVGYAEEDAGQNDGTHWIIKNSWGASWGEKGFFRLKAMTGGKGLCNVAEVASYPVKTKPNMPTPEVCDPFAWTECPAGGSCSCRFSFFGLFCLWHDCCPLADGVTCSDLKHCCPGNSTCDEPNESCVSSDGRSVAWSDKSPADVATPETINLRSKGIQIKNPSSLDLGKQLPLLRFDQMEEDHHHRDEEEQEDEEDEEEMEKDDVEEKEDEEKDEDEEKEEHHHHHRHHHDDVDKEKEDDDEEKDDHHHHHHKKGDREEREEKVKSREQLVKSSESLDERKDERTSRFITNRFAARGPVDEEVHLVLGRAEEQGQATPKEDADADADVFTILFTEARSLGADLARGSVSKRPDPHRRPRHDKARVMDA